MYPIIGPFCTLDTGYNGKVGNDDNFGGL